MGRGTGFHELLAVLVLGRYRVDLAQAGPREDEVAHPQRAVLDQDARHRPAAAVEERLEDVGRWPSASRWRALRILSCRWMDRTRC